MHNKKKTSLQYPLLAENITKWPLGEWGDAIADCEFRTQGPPWRIADWKAVGSEKLKNES
jgi:hypothetical protein